MQPIARLVARYAGPEQDVKLLSKGEMTPVELLKELRGRQLFSRPFSFTVPGFQWSAPLCLPGKEDHRPMPGVEDDLLSFQPVDSKTL